MGMPNKKNQQHDLTCDESLPNHENSIISNSDTLNEEVSCPVCHTKSSLNESEFVLHFLNCSAKTFAPPRDRMTCSPHDYRPHTNQYKLKHSENANMDVAEKTHCSVCKAIYTSRCTDYEIEFHKDECRRNNYDYKTHSDNTFMTKFENTRSEAHKLSDTHSFETSETRRPLKHARTLSKECVTGRTVKKSSSCAICLSDSSSQNLIRCSATCGQMFHPLCIKANHLQIAQLKKSNKNGTGSLDHFPWTCGHCLRAIHLCQICGFLGKDGEDLLQCSVASCQAYFHSFCLGQRIGDPVAVPTSSRSEKPMGAYCSVGFQNNDTDTLIASCSTDCARSEDRQINANNDYDRFMCQTCRIYNEKDTMKIIKRRGLRRSLQSQISIGEIVLVLPERFLLRDGYCANSDLIWGIVVRIELLKDYLSYENGIPATECMSPDILEELQILTIESFMDARTWNLTNAQVLSIAAADNFDTPLNMLRNCIEWYTYIQCVNFFYSGYRKQSDDIANERAKLLQKSCAAFRGYTRKVMLAHTQHHDALTSMSWASANRGFENFEKTMARSEPVSFSEITEAPVFSFL